MILLKIARLASRVWVAAKPSALAAIVVAATLTAIGLTWYPMMSQHDLAWYPMMNPTETTETAAASADVAV